METSFFWVVGFDIGTTREKRANFYKHGGKDSDVGGSGDPTSKS